MFTASLNTTELNRITDKLNKLRFVMSDLDNPDNPVKKFKVSVLVSYQNAIVRAMGSVKVVDYSKGELGFHGRVIIDLQDIGTAQTHWSNLHPDTVRYKQKAKMRMSIWEATGTAKKAVKIHSETSFVGIDGSDPEALKHALAVEYGHGITPDGVLRDWERRALFTIANDVVLKQKQEILDKIRKIILTYVSWGS